jgi:AraC-like DNA-binding protein
MLILLNDIPPVTPVLGPVSPLNAIWYGTPRQRIRLPQPGHLLLVFPLNDTTVSCSDITVSGRQYILLAPSPDSQPVHLDVLGPDADQAQILVLWFSPPFITEMAGFLQIPDNLQQLLHGLPLLQGDQLSMVVAELAANCRLAPIPDILEDLLLEIIGELLRLMRLRHQALQRLASHRLDTVADVLPRLLQARQFVEARFSQKFKTREIADSIGLSEFHFARLFKTAFDVPVRQYVIRLRLDAARRLLEQPEASVTGTAYSLGYASLSSFIHAFTSRFGISPAQYQAWLKVRKI